MRKYSVFLASLLFATSANYVAAETDSKLYLGLGLSSLALDSDRVLDVPTSSPGHAPKEFNVILGYQFDELWAADLTLGTDFSGNTSADQLMLNGYRFFGSSKWKPFVSAGLSAFNVDDATNDSSQQIQAGFGISGNLSDNLEFRAGYQLFSELGSDSNFDKALGLSLNWHLGNPVAAAVSQPKPVPEPESVPINKEVVDTFELLVEFSFDKSDITSAHEPQFKEIAQVLSSSPEINMTIEGHTDWTGTDDYNLSLSERRADAVKTKFIQEYAISADRIDVIAYGELRPIEDNSTAEGRARNRRAISVILRPRMVTE